MLVRDYFPVIDATYTSCIVSVFIRYALAVFVFEISVRIEIHARTRMNALARLQFVIETHVSRSVIQYFYRRKVRGRESGIIIEPIIVFLILRFIPPFQPMEYAAQNILHLERATLSFQQVERSNTSAIIVWPYIFNSTVCKCLNLLSTYYINTIKGYLRHNQFFTEVRPIRLKVCLASCFNK